MDLLLESYLKSLLSNQVKVVALVLMPKGVRERERERQRERGERGVKQNGEKERGRENIKGQRGKERERSKEEGDRKSVV